jgi:hypothetical protein
MDDNDTRELFAALLEAAEDAGLDLRADESEGDYRENGTVDVRLNGRTFRLDLSELC